MGSGNVFFAPPVGEGYGVEARRARAAAVSRHFILTGVTGVVAAVSVVTLLRGGEECYFAAVSAT
jgi:hypothetical protein